MKIIGLTGGIASGKSTVASILQKLGAHIFDADIASRQAVARGSQGLQQVIDVFGRDYLTIDGELDRQKIAQLVFENKAALGQLESIVHTYVRCEAKKFLEQCRRQNFSAAVLDVPLLIECGWYKEVDLVWLVAVDEQTQIERAMARSGMSQQEVEVRIAAQMTLAAKCQYADLIIDNSGSLKQTGLTVKKEWEKVLQMED